MPDGKAHYPVKRRRNRRGQAPERRAGCRDALSGGSVAEIDDLGGLVYETILANMRDGVMTIDLSGRVITFNAAAGRILGRDPGEIVGHSFGEAFLIDESLDDFNEVVLKAVYDNETIHARDITIEVNGNPVDLHVASSFLMIERDGVRDRHGVIVVFSDTTEERKRRKIKRLFGEYVDPRIVERILQRGNIAEERGRRARMTISFSDLRGFTGWSERLDPERLVDLINRFLTEMTTAIGAAGGLTDKFIGDAVMACWGPPFSDPESQATDACRSALMQVEALPRLRSRLAAGGLADAERVDVSIGLATGEVVAGDIGSEQSRNFTVIGNAVNVAARLQATAGHYGQRIMVSEETRRAAGDGFVFREIDRIALRGRQAVDPVHALVGRAGEVDGRALEIAETHEAGVEAMAAGDRAGARRHLQRCLALDPGDRAARVLMQRCEAAQEA